MSRYSGKLVRTLSALEQYFHRKTTRMVATVFKNSIYNFILPGKGYMTTTKVLADKDILGFKSSVCGWTRSWFGHATECLIVGRRGGEEAVV